MRLRTMPLEEKVRVISPTLCVISWVFFILLFCAVPVQGQMGQSGITGRVTDPSGAVVPNVTITITNEKTAASVRTSSGDAGVYRVRNLPPGSYTISAEGSGFQKVIVEHVVTEVDKVSSVDIALRMGKVEQTVRVTATPTLLTTTGGTVGTLVSEKEIETLPLNGRSWVSLTFLSPGAINYYPASAHSAATVAGVSPINFVVNGLRPGNNLFFIDGVSQTDPDTHLLGIFPPLDALAEFRVETSNYSAEYYGGGAAVVSAVTKSGTNQLHGSVWEFLRNNVFDARNFFSTTVPALKRNQFGASLGGPIRKDKVFFFGSYEGFRQVQDIAEVGNFPTAAERNGNLSDLPGQVIDPLTGTPFQKNIIPSDRINSLNASYLSKYIPLPNYPVPVGSGNFRYLRSEPVDWDSAIGRVDMDFSDKSRMFARFMYTNSSLNQAVQNPIFTQDRTQPSSDLSVQYLHTFSPTMLFEGRFGMHHFDHSEPSSTTTGANMADALGISGADRFTTTAASNKGAPEIAVSGFSAFGGSSPGAPRQWINTGLFYDGVLTWLRGPHSIRVGGSAAHSYAEFAETLWPLGNWNYSGFFTGSGLGDYLLGYPRTILSASPFDPQLRRWTEGLWGQDDWRVTSRLELNLGLRWDLDGRYSDARNRIANFDLSQPPTAITVLAENPLPGWTRSLIGGPQGEMAPRFGFAYKLKGNFVVRGGYGIFWQAMAADPTANLSVNAPYSSGAFATFDQASLPTFDRANPLASASTIGLGGYAVTRNFQDSNAQQWNLTVEKALGPDNLISVAYLGNKGSHLITFADPNGAPPGPGPIQPRRPYTNIGSLNYLDSSRDSSYQGLHVKFERRSSKNLTLTIAYAFGKAIDDSSGYYNETFTGATLQEVRNPSADRGLSGFNAAQTLTVGYSYQLPFGSGEKFGRGTTGMTGKLISDWQLSGMTIFRSGLPVTATMVTNLLNTGAAAQYQYPNRVCDPNNFPHTSHGQEVNEFFNTACFVPAPAYTYGNGGRDTIIGPSFTDFDFALFKETTIGERLGVEFRAEAFNLFNHPSFAGPVAEVGSSANGKIFGASDPREIQLGLRLTF